MQPALKLRRAKRFQRRESPPAFQLTSRDIAILTHVARHRFLSSQHLVALDGGSEQNLLRCLRALFDHQYLDRPYAQLAYMPVTGPRPMVYGLGRRGAQALRQYGRYAEGQTDWTERNKRAGAKFIEHTLSIADFMVALEVSCRKHPDIRLIREAEIIAKAPARTRSAREPLRLVVPGLSAKLGVSSVIADGLFGLGFSDDTAVYFLLELDRGTMPVKRFAIDKTSYERKLLVYWEVWKKKIHVEHFGVNQIRMLTITENARRIDTMLQALADSTKGTGSNFFLFADKKSFRSDPLAAVWQSGKREWLKLID